MSDVGIGPFSSCSIAYAPYRLEELAAKYRLLAIYGPTDYVRSDC